MSNQNTTLHEVQSSVMQQIEHDLGQLTYAELQHLMVVGLGEEAGEVLGLLKRRIRNFTNDKDRATHQAFVEELGDVLWYLAGAAYAYNITLQEIWDYNVTKLKERYPQ